MRRSLHLNNPVLQCTAVHSSKTRAKRVQSCPLQALTFDLQDQIWSGAVADEALRGDAPQVVLWLWAEADAASRHGHATAGTQAALLQQL